MLKTPKWRRKQCAPTGLLSAWQTHQTPSPWNISLAVTTFRPCTPWQTQSPFFKLLALAPQPLTYTQKYSFSNPIYQVGPCLLWCSYCTTFRTPWQTHSPFFKLPGTFFQAFTRHWPATYPPICFLSHHFVSQLWRSLPKMAMWEFLMCEFLGT